MKFLQKQFQSRATGRRYVISVIRPVRTNERGFVETVETEVGKFWASVTPISEQLRLQFQSQSVQATHSITVDGRADILESDKIKFGERLFDIQTIKQVDELDRDKIIITSEIRPK